MLGFFYLLFSYLYLLFFNDTASTEIYTLSLHDALPIWSTGHEPAAQSSLQRVWILLAPDPGHEFRRGVSADWTGGRTRDRRPRGRRPPARAGSPSLRRRTTR